MRIPRRVCAPSSPLRKYAPGRPSREPSTTRRKIGATEGDACWRAPGMDRIEQRKKKRERILSISRGMGRKEKSREEISLSTNLVSRFSISSTKSSILSSLLIIPDIWCIYRRLRCNFQKRRQAIAWILRLFRVTFCCCERNIFFSRWWRVLTSVPRRRGRKGGRIFRFDRCPSITQNT